MRPRLTTLPLALMLITVGTAVPVELRSPVPWSTSFGVPDFLLNVALYLPLGVSMWRRHTIGIVLMATLMSALIEWLQLRYFGRVGGTFDVVANAMGSYAGLLLGRWIKSSGRGDASSFPVDSRVIVLAAAGASLLCTAWILPAKSSALTNWDRSFDLLVGNERTLDRPWLGKLAELALVPDSLDTVERISLPQFSDPGVPAELLRRKAYVLPAPLTLEVDSIRKISDQHAHVFADLAMRRNAFTVIARIEVADVEQSGPARIVSFSHDQFNRNFDLGQEGDRLVFRVRTPSTGLNGSDPHIVTPPILSANKSTFVVASFDGSVARLHVDGRAVGRQDLAAAGCSVRFLCGSDLRFAAALFGALVAIVTLPLQPNLSRRSRVALVMSAGLASAALVRLLAVDNGQFLSGWGAALSAVVGSISVAVSWIHPRSVTTLSQ